MTHSNTGAVTSTVSLEAPLANGVSSTRWAPLMLLSLAICAGAAMRNLFSPLQETIRLDMGLSDTQMGLIQGVAISLPITLLSLPFGRLIDRYHRTRLLFALSLSWTAGTFLTAVAHGFALLFAAHMLIGFGLFCAIPTAISLAADLSAPHERGRAIFMLMVGDVTGASLAFGLGGLALGAFKNVHSTALLNLSSWRVVQWIFGAASMITALMLLALSEPRRNETMGRAQVTVREAIIQLWQQRRLLIPLCVGQLGMVMAITAASIWSAPLLARNYGLNDPKIGAYMAWVMLSTGLIGAVMGGLLADAGYKSARPSGVLHGAVAATALALPASVFALMPNPTGYVLMLSVMLCAGTVTSVVTSTALALVIANELRGMALTVLGTLNGLVGFGITPTLVPALTWLDKGSHRLGLALVSVTLFVNAVSLVGYLIAACRMDDLPVPSARRARAANVE